MVAGDVTVFPGSCATCWHGYPCLPRLVKALSIFIGVDAALLLLNIFDDESHVDFIWGEQTAFVRGCDH